MNKHSLKCMLWKVLWVLSLVSLAIAWVSIMRQAPVLGIDPGLLLWTGVILASLSVPVKLDCTSCGGCSV
jgi:hypothetical protein